MMIPNKDGQRAGNCRETFSKTVVVACVVTLQIWNWQSTAAAANEQLTSAPAESASRPGGLLLIAAVKERRVETVQRLVRDGIDVNSSVSGEGTALIAASRLGDLEMIDELLRLGADVNRSARGDGSPLIAAAITGDLRVIQRLLEAGADVNGVVGTDETPLINASRAGRLAAVKFLAERGADVNLGVTADNGQRRTPLNQARTEEIKVYLASKGAVR